MPEQNVFSVNAALPADALDEAVGSGGRDSQNLLLSWRVPRVQTNFADHQRCDLCTAEPAVETQQQQQPIERLAVSQEEPQFFSEKVSTCSRLRFA